MSWRDAVGMFAFLRRRSALIAALVVLSVAVGILDGIAISLVFPILQGGGDSASNYPFPFNQIAAAFAGMSVAGRLQWIALLLVATTLTKGVMVYAAALLTSRLQLAVMRHFRLCCVEELLRLGMNSFNRHKPADFQLVIESNTDSSASSIVGLIGGALPQMFSAGVLIGCLFFLSWRLTLATLLMVGLASVAVAQVTRNIGTASALVYGARAAFSRTLMATINGMKIIRLFSREAYVAERLTQSIDAFNATRFRADRLLGMVVPAFETIGMTMLAVVLFAGSFLVVAQNDGRIDVLLGFMVILGRLITPVKAVNHARATLTDKLPALLEIRKLLDPAGKEYVRTGPRPFRGLTGEVVFEDVWFGYDGEHRPVLRDVCLTLRRGTKMGVVGTSGGGKSTLTELLLRFYDPQRGRILVDGVDLRELDLAAWRRRIGVVSQDVFLFDDTIANNIAFACPGASEEQIHGAARLAYADDFIRQLPAGYDTRVGDRGVLLSAGQRQRIAIARAVIGDPDILVFDEATSALDSESERYVQAALSRVGEGRTVVAVAHRLATVHDADEIVVIQSGAIVERGSHLNLLACRGAYARLAKLQEMETVQA